MRTWTINNQFVGLMPGQMLALEDGHVQMIKLRAVQQAQAVEVTPLEGGQFVVRGASRSESYLLVECNQEELGDAVRLVLADTRMK